MVRQYILALTIIVGLNIPATNVWASGGEGDVISASTGTSFESSGSKGYRTRRITRLGRYRTGFTLQLGAGIGAQRQDTTNVEPFTSVAVGGLNVGFGAFVERWIAILIRFSGSVAFPPPEMFASTSMAGVMGTAVQLWPADWLKFEVGFGLAYQRVRRREIEGIDYGNYGVGVITNASWVFWQRRQHTLQLGLTYTPLLVPGAPVHAWSFNFVYQLL